MLPDGADCEGPLSISTFGGWETHDDSVVIINGVTCVPLPLGTTKIEGPDPDPPVARLPRRSSPS